MTSPTDLRPWLRMKMTRNQSNERTPSMFSRLSAVTTVAACLLSFAATATVAPAQENTKVGVCNPARVFGEMQETKDLKQKIESQQKQLKADIDARQQKVKDLQAQRDLLK